MLGHHQPEGAVSGGFREKINLSEAVTGQFPVSPKIAWHTRLYGQATTMGALGQHEGQGVLIFKPGRAGEGFLNGLHGHPFPMRGLSGRRTGVGHIDYGRPAGIQRGDQEHGNHGGNHDFHQSESGSGHSWAHVDVAMYTGKNYSGQGGSEA